MTKDTTKEAAVAAEALLLDDWFDAIEDGVRARARGFIETMLEEELSEALSRPRYGRRKPGEDEAAPSVVGVRHGHRERTLTGTFGKTRIAVPRARLTGEAGKTREWRSGSLRAYQRRTRAADALIAGAYLAGTNTRRVRRALNAVFAGPVGKDVVSRVWRKTKGDWDAWNARSLAEEPIVRLILDGTVARVRLDRRATSISLLVALGVRADGQKMLLAIKSMGGEGEAMLSINTQEHKQRIVANAFRILRLGGRYGIHELCVVPDDMPREQKQAIDRALSSVIRVGARPLPAHEWSALLEGAGFRIVQIGYAPMHLLRACRLIQDEGVLGALRLAKNILLDGEARRRVFAMRQVFERYRENLSAVFIVAEKVRE